MARFSNHAFTDQPEANAAHTTPGGYRVTHVFQCQDDEETNAGQYAESCDVASWDDLPSVIETLMSHPHAAGFTLSIEVTARNVAS